MKKFFLGTIIGCIVFAGTAFAEEEKDTIVLTIGSTTVRVVDETVENDVPPIIRNDRTMIPLRFVAENLGADVEWDGDTKQVTIGKGFYELIFTIDSDTVLINGEEEINDSPAFIENDRTYVPIRLICESLDSEVTWNPETQEITIFIEHRVKTTITYRVDIVSDDYEYGIDYNAIKTMIETRLAAQGYYDVDVRVNSENHIELSLDMEFDDMEKTVEELRLVPTIKYIDYAGNVLLRGEDGDMDFVAIYEETDGTYTLVLRLTDEGKDKFKAATARISKLREGYKYINIMLDDKMIAQSQITREIDGYGVIVKGDFNPEEVGPLEEQIRFAISPIRLVAIDMYRK